jgi:tetratricopeptide (TPR) repeat protein
MAKQAKSGSAASIEALQQTASAALQQGRLGDALAACRAILARQPERADVHAFAGMVALRQGDAAGAARSYETAVTLRPDFAEAHFNHGNALKQLNRPEEAAAAYRHVLDLRPDIAPAWHNLGNVLLALDRPGEAVDAYRRVLAIDAANPDTHRNLGIAQQKTGALDGAIAAYGDALARRPGWPPAASNLVQALFEAGDAAGAVAVCDDWLTHHPGHVEAMALKCAALNEAGDTAALDVLLDFDRFALERRIEVPAGYDSLDDFNAALTDYVLSHPTLKVPPADDPTYHHPKLQITDEILGETISTAISAAPITSRCRGRSWTRNERRAGSNSAGRRTNWCCAANRRCARCNRCPARCCNSQATSITAPRPMRRQAARSASPSLSTSWPRIEREQGDRP